MKKILLFAILTSVMSIATKAQKPFDITSGGKIKLDREKYEGTWVSKNNPNDLKLNISFKNVHIKKGIRNYYADAFILHFIKLNIHGEDLASKYPRIESEPITREGTYHTIFITDLRANQLAIYNLAPMKNGDLQLTSLPDELRVDNPNTPWLIPLKKPIILQRAK